MNKVINKNSTREELVNALIDLFDIREPIEAYLVWLEKTCEYLLFVYNSKPDRCNGFDSFEDLGGLYHG